jgi:phosphohistidine phosphatase
MALQLLLLRHAKSSWGDPDLDDHNRPLSERGSRVADVMASFLAAENLSPDLVLCSTAERTRRTLDPILQNWPDLPVRYEDDLYLASVSDVVKHLEALEGVYRVLVIGHDPAMKEVARHLISRSMDHNSQAMANLSVKYPTGALAILNLNIESWNGIARGCGQLTHFIKPRDLDQ